MNHKLSDVDIILKYKKEILPYVPQEAYPESLYEFLDALLDAELITKETYEETTNTLRELTKETH